MWATSWLCWPRGGAKGRQGSKYFRKTVSALLTLCSLWLILCWCANLGAAAQAISLPGRMSNEPFTVPLISNKHCHAPSVSMCWLAAGIRAASQNTWLAAILFLHEYFSFWQVVCNCSVRILRRLLFFVGLLHSPKRVWQARIVQKQRFKQCRRRNLFCGRGKLCYRPASLCIRSKRHWCTFPAQSTSSSAGLNGLFRGGANGSHVTAKRRGETHESALLQGLQALLQQYNTPPPGGPKGKGKQSERNASPDSEASLLKALQRIIARSQKKPGTLLQRLNSLVQSASNGQPFAGKAKKEKKPAVPANPPRNSLEEPPAKRPKLNGKGKGEASQPAAVETTSRTAKGGVKGKSKVEPSKVPPQKRQAQGAPSTTWAQIAGRPPAANPASGSKPDIALLRGAFGPDDICDIGQVRTALEQGQCPKGKIALCFTMKTVEDCLKLCELHKIDGQSRFAVITPTVSGEACPATASVLALPTWEQGKPNVRTFWAFKFGSALPDLPTQRVCQTKVPVAESRLHTFRATLVRSLVSRDVWETWKRNPRHMCASTFVPPTLHSNYGWQEKEVATRSSEPDDVILQGFVRCKDDQKSKVLDHVGDDGLFVDQLASASEPRQAVRWMTREDNEDPKAYLARVSEVAKKMNSAVAHRRGGGNFLGVRLAPGTYEPVTKTWSLTGAPRVWTGQDVVQCLLESCCTSVAILKPPAKTQGWLVKATVKAENALGIVAISADDRQLLLTRVQPKVKRSTKVICNIRPSNSRPTEMEIAPTTRALTQDGRERTPRGEKETIVVKPVEHPSAPHLHNDKYDAVECGAKGNCGYLCLAMALGLERGEDVETLKSSIPARAVTIRHDLYTHMKKHQAEYSDWFSSKVIGTAEQEGGDVPNDWESSLLYLERWPLD